MPGRRRKRRGGYLANDKKYRYVTHDSYEWRVWIAMHQRYPALICDRWLHTTEGGGFANFVHDMGGYGTRPAGTTLARVDRTQPFSPDNCYWKLRIVNDGHG